MAANYSPKNFDEVGRILKYVAAGHQPNRQDANRVSGHNFGEGFDPAASKLRFEKQLTTPCALTDEIPG